MTADRGVYTGWLGVTCVNDLGLRGGELGCFFFCRLALEARKTQKVACQDLAFSLR